MGKKKDKQQHQENNQPCNRKESPNEENKNNPKEVIILGVYINCDGCKNRVLESLRGFDGVEETLIDEENHKVMVKGKKADPLKVAERLRKKSGKHVELISPIPVPPKKKEEKKEIKQEVIEVSLKLYMHCKDCVEHVKKCLHKVKGVQTVDPEMENNLVKVKGSMDPRELVDFISKKSGKHAEIVKSSNINKENDEKGLVKPLKRLVPHVQEVITWERPLASCILVVTTMVVIYKEWVGKAIAALLLGIVATMIWARRRRIPDEVHRIVVYSGSDQTTMESIVSAQQGLRSVYDLIQTMNVILLKIWSILESKAPKHADLVMVALVVAAVILAVVPFKFILMSLASCGFVAASQTGKSKQN